MYQGKRVKRNVHRKKTVWLLASLALLFTVSVGGTLAFLMHQAGPVTNTFALETLPSKVVEKIEGGVKNEVKIQNASTSQPAYIRAMVVATWAEVDVSGNPTGNVYSTVPAEDTDYSMTWTKDGWQEYPAGSGYYYYTSPVDPGAETGVLFTGCAPKLTDGKTPNQPDGNYKLSIEIIAQSIQANGADAKGNKPIELAWGVDISDGGVGPATLVS